MSRTLDQVPILPNTLPQIMEALQDHGEQGLRHIDYYVQDLGWHGWFVSHFRTLVGGRPGFCTIFYPRLEPVVECIAVVTMRDPYELFDGTFHPELQLLLPEEDGRPDYELVDGLLMARPERGQEFVTLGAQFN